MKLHTKLILALLVCLSVVLILAQTAQFFQISGQLSDLSESNIELLTDREASFAKNLYGSVAKSVAGSLNRGQMEKFGDLLRQTREIEGLMEFSLFDTRSESVTYSSDNQFISKQLPSEISSKIRSSKDMIFQITDEAIEIYHPQPVVADCLRCHTDWNLSMPHGGVMFFRFSAEALTQAKEQAVSALGSLKTTYLFDAIISVVAVILVLVVSIFFLLRKMVAKPLAIIGDNFNEAAAGDLTVVTDIRTDDEIGKLSEDFNMFIKKLHEMVASIARQVDSLKNSSSGLNGVSSEMSQGALDMSSRAHTVADSSVEMSRNMASVADSMTEANNNINMVAAATEEMTTTIDEISNNAVNAREISAQAVEEAENATLKMKNLGESAQNIGKVTETITEISEQTNLLALNATIEAARAGDAGKGFAVVASEIKDLANQTASATTEISQRIGEIQKDTEGAIVEIEHISQVINNVDNIISSIAAAVNEQSTATREISSNISLASHGIDQVSDNVQASSNVSDGISREIQDVDSASKEISASSGKVKESAEDLANLAETLRDMVLKFKI